MQWKCSATLKLIRIEIHRKIRQNYNVQKPYSDFLWTRLYRSAHHFHTHLSGANAYQNGKIQIQIQWIGFLEMCALNWKLGSDRADVCRRLYQKLNEHALDVCFRYRVYDSVNIPLSCVWLVFGVFIFLAYLHLMYSIHTEKYSTSKPSKNERKEKKKRPMWRWHTKKRTATTKLNNGAMEISSSITPNETTR